MNGEKYSNLDILQFYNLIAGSYKLRSYSDIGLRWNTWGFVIAVNRIIYVLISINNCDQNSSLFYQTFLVKVLWSLIS